MQRKSERFLLTVLSVCSRPSQVRRSAFTRSPLKKSATPVATPSQTPVATPSEKFTSPVEKFNKTSSAPGLGSPVTSAKSRTSVDKTTPRSSRTKISSSGSVTGKSADQSSAKKSAIQPQSTSRSEKNSSNSKQRIASGQSIHSRASVASPSSSGKTSDSVSKTPISSRLGANKAMGSKSAEAGTGHSDLKPTEMVLELKTKGPAQQSSTTVVSGREKVSEKQPISARKDSRPASRLSAYVSYNLVPTIVDNFYCHCQRLRRIR